MKTIRICALLLAGLAVQPLAAAGSLADSCKVSKGQQKNETLMAYVPPEGTFVFYPGGPGFVDQDGALGMKFAWSRLVPGMIQAGGKRLDGNAPPARVYFNKGYGKRGFHPSYLVFPTPGCWQITGRLADQSLTFIVWVEKVGDGPTWKYKLPDDGSWYSTQL